MDLVLCKFFLFFCLHDRGHIISTRSFVFILCQKLLYPIRKSGKSNLREAVPKGCREQHRYPGRLPRGHIRSHKDRCISQRVLLIYLKMPFGRILKGCFSKKHPLSVPVLLVEISLQQSLKRLTVTGLVACHFMDSVMDCI